MAFNADDRESHLQRPGVHDFLHSGVLVESPVFVGLRSQVEPKVVLLSGLVLAEIIN